MPRTAGHTAASRSGISLEPFANRAAGTNKRRDECFRSFQAWIRQELGIEINESNFPPHLMSWALIGFGKFLFYEGKPKYQFAETINSTIDRFPSYRGLFSSAWATLKKWEEAEPVERSMVMPAALFQAAVGLCLLWSWPKVASIMILGFHGLLRPNEILPLKRRDLVLPRDVLSDELICYVRILHSKTSRFLLRQHARVRDQLSVAFLDATFGCLPMDEPLFNCSPGVFRTRWNKIFKFFGVPCAEKLKGLTPKSLRGSGASWLFHHTEDVERVLWRGRWQSRRTLEHYLQDVMGQVLLSDLPQEKRDLVASLAAASSSLLVHSCRLTSVIHV